jgi:hypothetical protein
MLAFTVLTRLHRLLFHVLVHARACPDRLGHPDVLLAGAFRLVRLCSPGP